MSNENPIELQIKRRRWNLIGQALRHPENPASSGTHEVCENFGRPKNTWRHTAKSKCKTCCKSWLELNPHRTEVHGRSLLQPCASRKLIAIKSITGWVKLATHFFNLSRASRGCPPRKTVHLLRWYSPVIKPFFNQCVNVKVLNVVGHCSKQV